jgi:hypothetical protein
MLADRACDTNSREECGCVDGARHTFSSRLHLSLSGLDAMNVACLWSMSNKCWRDSFPFDLFQELPVLMSSSIKSSLNTPRFARIRSTLMDVRRVTSLSTSSFCLHSMIRKFICAAIRRAIVASSFCLISSYDCFAFCSPVRFSCHDTPVSVSKTSSSCTVQVVKRVV